MCWKLLSCIPGNGSHGDCQMNLSWIWNLTDNISYLVNSNCNSTSWLIGQVLCSQNLKYTHSSGNQRKVISKTQQIWWVSDIDFHWRWVGQMIFIKTSRMILRINTRKILKMIIVSSVGIPLSSVSWGNDISKKIKHLPFNTLRPRQNGRHFPDDIFQCIFMNENAWISIEISLKFVIKGPIYNIPALVQIMAWCQPGDKPLSEPVLVSLLMYICVTRPQWVKICLDAKASFL